MGAQFQPHSSSENTDSGALIERFRRARDRRVPWEGHWQECYDYALPQRTVLFGATPGGKRGERLFDGTAPDAVEHLAASLLAELTPPWARWFGFEGGPSLSEAERAAIAPLLEDAGETLRQHFDRSTFAVEVHQAFLDLVTVGTAALLFEEAKPGEASAFRFSAVPLPELTLEEGAGGRLDTIYRSFEAPLAVLEERFPGAVLPEVIRAKAQARPDTRFAVIEAVEPSRRGGLGGYDYTALLLGEGEGARADEAHVLASGRFGQSPFIVFRWLKAPGESYGRSPVMTALPDIKTANKVVELVLKNASIAVTGIWQADDDGVLNPATVRLIPGAIIPKAVGSSGLTPLQAPGRFDVSQLVLDDLRGRIRHALLADRLGQIDAPRMTATEVIERSAQMARLLGATFGRLQSELLTPLVTRASAILRRRGEIPDIRVDGRLVALQYRAPLARQQNREEARTALTWLDALSALGPQAQEIVDPRAVGQWLARALGVPADLLRPLPEPVPEEGVRDVL